MADSNLYNRVTFSGADTTVIAYRPVMNAEQKKALADREDDLNKIEISIRDIDDKIKRIEQEHSNAGERLIAYTDSRQLQEEQYYSVGPRLTPFDEVWNGRMQNNRKAYEDATRTAEEQIAPLLKSRRAEESAKADVEREVKELGANVPVTLSNLHTITYSSFREKFAVRTLGRSSAKSYTRGARTIAGTMVFNSVQEQELMQLAMLILDKDSAPHPKSVLVDQIMPFDIAVVFANEYGGYSAMHMFNIEINSEGQEMSIDNILTQNSFNFYATDIVPMSDQGNMFKSYAHMMGKVIQDGVERKNGAKIGAPHFLHRLDNLINDQHSLERRDLNEMLAQSRGLF